MQTPQSFVAGEAAADVLLGIHLVRQNGGAVPELLDATDRDDGLWAAAARALDRLEAELRCDPLLAGAPRAEVRDLAYCTLCLRARAALLSAGPRPQPAGSAGTGAGRRGAESGP
jgi:hypothetical protein